MTIDEFNKNQDSFVVSYKMNLDGTVTSSNHITTSSNSNLFNQLSRGWECPKCAAVMNPSVPSCINCTGHK